MQSYETDEEMDILIKQLVSFGPGRQYIIGNNQMGSFISLSDAMDGRCQQYDAVFILHPDGEHCIGEGAYLSVCYSRQLPPDQDLCSPAPGLCQGTFHEYTGTLAGAFVDRRPYHKTCGGTGDGAAVKGGLDYTSKSVPCLSLPSSASFLFISFKVPKFLQTADNLTAGRQNLRRAVIGLFPNRFKRRFRYHLGGQRPGNGVIHHHFRGECLLQMGFPCAAVSCKPESRFRFPL